MSSAISDRSRVASHWASRTLGAATGVGLAAVFAAMTAGGAVYALGGSPARAASSAPAATSAPASAPGAAGAPSSDPAQVALKAADDARTMFGLLSNALAASTSGLASAMAGVPQVFDSVATAQDGAAEVAAGLDETATAAAAMDQVSESAQQWSGTITRIRDLSGATSAVRANSIDLRKQLIAHPTPDSAATVQQLDKVIAATGGMTPLDSVESLSSSLKSLTDASAKSSASLAKARAAAHKLSDGLATIENARPQAMAATANLSTGTKQLGIALTSIDGQLALIQQQLRAEVAANAVAAKAAAAAPAQDSSDRLAWAICAAGGAGAVVYLVGFVTRSRARRTPPAAAAEPQAPLADLARAISEIPTPAHGFPRPDVFNTDPWLPVQFAREHPREPAAQL